jgi:hypothetical protein
LCKRETGTQLKLEVASDGTSQFHRGVSTTSASPEADENDVTALLQQRELELSKARDEIVRLKTQLRAAGLPVEAPLIPTKGTAPEPEPEPEPERQREPEVHRLKQQRLPSPPPSAGRWPTQQCNSRGAKSQKRKQLDSRHQEVAAAAGSSQENDNAAMAKTSAAPAAAAAADAPAPAASNTRPPPIAAAAATAKDATMTSPVSRKADARLRLQQRMAGIRSDRESASVANCGATEFIGGNRQIARLNGDDEQRHKVDVRLRLQAKVTDLHAGRECADEQRRLEIRQRLIMAQRRQSESPSGVAATSPTAQGTSSREEIRRRLEMRIQDARD